MTRPEMPQKGPLNIFFVAGGLTNNLHVRLLALSIKESCKSSKLSALVPKGLNPPSKETLELFEELGVTVVPIETPVSFRYGGASALRVDAVSAILGERNPILVQSKAIALKELVAPDFNEGASICCAREHWLDLEEGPARNLDLFLKGEFSYDISPISTLTKPSGSVSHRLFDSGLLSFNTPSCQLDEVLRICKILIKAKLPERVKDSALDIAVTVFSHMHSGAVAAKPDGWASYPQYDRTPTIVLYANLFGALKRPDVKQRVLDLHDTADFMGCEGLGEITRWDVKML